MDDSQIKKNTQNGQGGYTVIEAAVLTTMVTIVLIFGYIVAHFLSKWW